MRLSGTGSDALSTAAETPPGEVVLTSALPAALVGLSALITTLLVHGLFGLWWLFRHFVAPPAPSYDWQSALTVSGIATTIVLLAGLFARHLVAAEAPPTLGEADAPSPTLPERPTAQVAAVPSRHR